MNIKECQKHFDKTVKELEKDRRAVKNRQSIISALLFIIISFTYFLIGSGYEGIFLALVWWGGFYKGYF